MNTGTFYNSIPCQSISLDEILFNHKGFCPVPEDWFVIITDIVNSTTAVSKGLHKYVNLIATGSAVLVLNIAFKQGIHIPFFFGGDGVTFLVPQSLEKRCMKALESYSAGAFENYELTLRAGSVTVREIYASGHELLITKYQYSNSFTIPLVLGYGLRHAEELVKNVKVLSEKGIQSTEPDLTGMLCRWDTIPAPEGKNFIVTLLVTACPEYKQSWAFALIMKEIERIYGFPANRQPITISKLKLKSTFRRLSAEMKSQIAGDWIALLLDRLFEIIGHLYFMTTKGRKYLKSLVEMSDTLIMDGRINTIISGTEDQMKELVAYLDQMEANGVIHYGIQSGHSSVMSCYVRNEADGHIYFIDGSEGGYTMAAQNLKSKTFAQI
jgi:hypothetical protein